MLMANRSGFSEKQTVKFDLTVVNSTYRPSIGFFYDLLQQRKQVFRLFGVFTIKNLRFHFGIQIKQMRNFILALLGSTNNRICGRAFECAQSFGFHRCQHVDQCGDLDKCSDRQIGHGALSVSTTKVR